MSLQDGPIDISLGSDSIDVRDYPENGRPTSAIYLGLSNLASSSSMTTSPAVHVGLGNTKLDYWTAGNKKAESEKKAKRNSVVSEVSGLPSPPGTESDLVLPNEPSLMMESPMVDHEFASEITPRLSYPQTLGMSVGRDVPPLSASNATLRPPPLTTSLSRSASSSSSFSADLPRAGEAGVSHRFLSDIARSDSAASRRRSGEYRKSSDGSRHSAHRHSPSLPISGSPNKSPMRLDRSITASPIHEEPNEDPRESPGGDLDARIQEAEEKIRLSRRPRTSTGMRLTPDHRLRKYDSYSRAGTPARSGDPQRRPISTTGNREARRSPLQTVAMGSGSSGRRELSGNSSGSAKRKAIPETFRSRHQELETPSPRSSRNEDDASPTNHIQSPLASTRPLSTSRLLARGYPTSISSPSRARGLYDAQTSRSDRRNYNGSISGTERIRSRDSRSSVFGPRGDLSARLSKLNIAPSDSVSMAGAKTDFDSPTKDPLDVLKRIETRQQRHNRQWEHDRGASVIGDTPSPRAATSLSSLRQQGGGVSPVRASTRLSQYSQYETRHKRSTGSLGGRSAASLDINSATTDHGRLLFEACRSLQAKLEEGTPLSGALASTSRSAEKTNSSLRNAVRLADQITRDGQTDLRPSEMRDAVTELLIILRDAGRTSDQHIRDLTRVQLDLPRYLRSASAFTPSTSVLSPKANTSSRDWPYDSSSRYQHITESPVRRSEELYRRPATSMGDAYSSPRRVRDSLPPNFGPSRNGGGGSLLSRVRSNLTPKKSESLQVIEASPPMPKDIPPVPISPARRNLLRKRNSVNSNHTVRGSGSFLPSRSPMKPTTAISAITAGTQSPPTSAKALDAWDEHPIRRSQDSARPIAGQMNRMDSYTESYYTANQGGSSYEPDAVSVLEQRLVEAQKNRDGSEEFGAELGRRATIGVPGKESFSDRFRATIRRGREGTE